VIKEIRVKHEPGYHLSSIEFHGYKPNEKQQTLLAAIGGVRASSYNDEWDVPL